MAGEKTPEEIAAEELEMRRERGDFVDDPEFGGTTVDGDAAVDPAAAPAAKAQDKTDPPADPAAPGKDQQGVPYARFKEVHQEMETERDARLRLEGENRALKAMAGGKIAPDADPAKPPEEKVDVGALRERAGELMMEGDTKGAAALHKQADEALLQMAEERSFKRNEEARATERAEAARTELVAVGKEMVAKYPFLDHNGPDADKDAIDDVVARRNANIEKGMAPAAALRDAANRIGELVSKAKGITSGGIADGKSTPTPEQARAKAAIERNAAAANAQPPVPVGGRGERGRVADGAIDVAKLSDAEFRALPETERARLRGDMV